MRTFIAVELPQEVKDALTEAQKQLSKTAAKMSLSHDFHLTLKFLGETLPVKVEAVKKCLAEVKFKKFSCALAGIGVFPSENYIRVIWAGVEPEDDFIELQQMINDSLDNVMPIEKNFKPHLTLARVNSAHDKRQFAQQIRGIKIKPAEFEITGFKLKKSTPRAREGPLYEDLASYPST